MNKNFRFSTGYVIFPIVFLILAQFIATVFSSLITSFAILLTFTIIVTLLLSGTITYKLSKSFILSSRGLITIIGLSSVSSFLFLLRINYGIYDYICPTGLLGLVSQVGKGNFPASYISFPEFPMNYHQGFIFLAGTISFLSGLLPSISIKLTFVALFFLLNISISVFFFSQNNRYYYLPTILFIGLGSLNVEFYTDLTLGWAKYINIFDMATSNSWPLAFLSITLCLFISVHVQYLHPRGDIAIASLIMFIMLSVSTINATVYSVVLISMILILIFFVYYLKFKFRRSYQYYVFVVSLMFFIVLILPRFIPSAFLIGDMYESPKMVIHLLEQGPIEYSKRMVYYLFLVGPIFLFGFFLTYQIVNNRIYDWRLLPITIFFVSFTFPFIFTVTNIDIWNNFHKFATISIFMAIVLIVDFLGSNYIHRIDLKKRCVLSYLILSIVVGLPTVYDIFSTRLDLDFMTYLYPEPEIAAVVTYLRTKNKIILPYKNSNLCSVVGNSAIAQYAGLFIRHSYHSDFLLSPTIEAEYLRTSLWSNSLKDIIEQLTSIKSDTIILVDPSHAAEFEAIQEQFNDPSHTITRIDGYLVYE
jgi:hypothetical protein